MQALSHLSNDLKAAGLHWKSMSEPDQDAFLAEWVLDGFEV